ncbi:hypothetical protein AVEN_239791-1 [Araneus ventricosus]|uniref:Transmembrane protein n=1 Tax=Araneus ventricosus TaxID=182803 RepID=A0A4Y2ET57_ARAVE|nr:hypothetical protein AVEN_239791-1 [Araneus ventricosus]
MDQTNQIPTSSSNASSLNQSAKEDLVDLLEEVVQYHELLGDIVEKLESKDSKPTSCSTPDTTRKATTPTPTTTPIRKISQSSRQHDTEILNRNVANSQRSGDVIQNTNEEIAECINFVCVLIFGIMGFGVFIMLLEFTPKSNVTAALSVVGACLLLVLMFSFMSTLARKRTPLNRR